MTNNIENTPVTMLDHVSIVLVEPTHPGNIGAVARAMKTMGLTRLTLVNPRSFPDEEATRRAAGADSVLDRAEVVEQVQAAVDDCTLVFGTSVRDREVSWPTEAPRAAARRAVTHLQSDDDCGRVAILFGRESSGLTNQELDLTDVQIRIPANPEYGSLNLASAVQIIAYELRMCCLAQAAMEPDLPTGAERGEKSTLAQRRRQTATRQQLDGYMQHLQTTLERIDFIKSNPPIVLMRKLTRLYNKAQLTVEEVQILRGILTAIERYADGSDSQSS